MKGDVVVVGCSPAGISAAISAAKGGAKTILLDKDLGEFHHPANTMFLGMASRADLKLKDSWIKHTLAGMRINSPSGRSLVVEAEGYFLDRETLDQDLLNQAEGLGVTILKEEALDIRQEEGQRYVKTREGEIAAKVVVDASGVEARLARKAGLAPMNHPQDVAWAFEATVEYPDLGEEKLFEYWIGSMAPGWKATFSPAGENIATLGVFVRGHGRDVQPFFRRFLKRFKAYKTPLYGEMKDLKIVSVERGGDPIATIPGEITAQGLMVVGGAAGQSGLAYSMRAGDICGTVAADSASSGDVSSVSLRKYYRLWQAEFGREYRLGRACLETLRTMKDSEIDDMVGKLGGKNNPPPGPLPLKFLVSSFKIARVAPKIIPTLIANVFRG